MNFESIYYFSLKSLILNILVKYTVDIPLKIIVNILTREMLNFKDCIFQNDCGYSCQMFDMAIVYECKYLEYTIEL